MVVVRVSTASTVAELRATARLDAALPEPSDAALSLDSHLDDVALPVGSRPSLFPGP
ncbi:hypothetical protein ACWERW_25140 [Streptomyces sp. NPDC004012]